MLFPSKIYEPTVIKLHQVTINYDEMVNDMWTFNLTSVI